MQDVIDLINSWVWSPALVYLCLGVGVYFSLRTRFLQVRHFKHMIKLTFDGKSSEAGVSSFQALAMTLSGRVGTGNIAGVATAIAFGGPGAVFWMWMVAFLGASTSFVECTLAQIYKHKQDGQYRGGPSYYIEFGLGWRWFAILFAAATVLSCGFLMPGVQANGIADGLSTAFNLAPVTVACAVVVALGLLIFGGVKRIAAFAQVVVPFMALGYILVALVVVALHIELVPQILSLIVRSAVGVDAGFGAMLGLAIQMGVKRGIYSNEAGQGTGPHAAAAAEVSHPAKQGLVQGFAVYIDTLFVCTATALMILIAGTYNVEFHGAMLVNGMPGVDAGPAFTQAAVESMVPGLGQSFVGIALTFFAFTTIVAYYYIAETNLAYLLRHKSDGGAVVMFAFKVLLLIAVMYGCVHKAQVAWGLGDIGVGIMAWLNIIAIILLQKPALLALKDYERQQAQGVDPQFDPQPLAIPNADYWVERKLADPADIDPSI